MKIEDRIRSFILEHLYFTQDNALRDDASFLATGVVDSMGVMELVALVQSEYGVTVAQHEVVVDNFDSITKVASFVRRKLARSAPAPVPVVSALVPERTPVATI